MSQPDNNQQERYTQDGDSQQDQHGWILGMAKSSPATSGDANMTEGPFTPLINPPQPLSISLVNAASPTGPLAQDMTESITPADHVQASTDPAPTLLLTNKQKANRRQTVLMATGSILALVVVLIASLLFIGRGNQSHTSSPPQSTVVQGGQPGGIPITSAATATSIAATSTAGGTIPAPGATTVAGGGPPAHPTSTPTQPPSHSTKTLFGFEDGTTQGWGHNGTQITAVVNSTDHVYSGSNALEIKFTGLKPTTYPYASGPVQQSVTPGSALILFVFVPSGLSIKGQLFVQQGSNFITQTTNGYLPLTSGTWNKFEFAMPANLNGKTIIQVGFQFLSSSGTQSGSLWIDAVRWQA
jgi:hypothetical protein